MYVVIMVVGYPQNYITKDISLTVYESKAGRPYMDIDNWAKTKWADEAARDVLLKNIYCQQR